MVYTVTFNPALDYIIKIENFEIGKINRSNQEIILPGGKGINVSIVLNSLGIETTTLGFIAGFTGNKIKEEIEKYNIKTDFVKLKNSNSRINVKIAKNSNTEETAINCTGPIIDKDNVEILFQKLEKIKNGDILVLSGSVSKGIENNIYEEICEKLKEKEIKIIVDTTKDLLLNTLKYKPFLIKPNKEELEEIGVIEGEIQRLLPDEHIYRNLNQIVCIHEIKPGETQAGFREEMEKLYQTVQKQIFHRNKTTDFQIGIGGIVNGYGDLKKSFKDSKKIIDYMDMLRYLYSDKNISVADFSKLGFFQIFEKIKNRDELMEYVPESLVKLYWYDKEHDGELIETLQAYLDCDKSANKAAEKLYVNYRTLSGRLKKIRDISGIDFKNSAEMLAVRNGIVLFKMAETL